MEGKQPTLKNTNANGRDAMHRVSTIGGNYHQGDVIYHNTIVEGQTVKVPRLLTNHIYKNADHLLGRDTELAQAHALLAQNCPTVLFNGIGGIGKTSVAIKYVAHYGHEYQHLAWLTVQSGLLETFTRSETLLDALHIKQQVIDYINGQQSSAALDLVFLKLNQLNRTLVVVDNANDLDISQKERLFAIANLRSNQVVTSLTV